MGGEVKAAPRWMPGHAKSLGEGVHDNEVGVLCH